jgi:hypothetical protein
LAVKGGSALMKSCRPLGSTTLVIWALVRGARNVANKTSVVRTIQAVIAVRFAILTCTRKRVTVPWGRRYNDFRCYSRSPKKRN